MNIQKIIIRHESTDEQMSHELTPEAGDVSEKRRAPVKTLLLISSGGV